MGKRPTDFRNIICALLSNSVVQMKDTVAFEVRKMMNERGLTPYAIIKKGVSKGKVYAVLRMGKNKCPNYTIDTLEEVLRAVL
jgi:methanogenic corrinoid protein MtbC1